MNNNRPRMNEREVSKWNKYKLQKRKIEKVLVASDFHGLLVDDNALKCLLEVIVNENFDEIVLNGDIIDLPFLSSHTSKLYETGVMEGYSEVKEIEFVKNNILMPIVNAAGKDCNVVYRLGNHEERLTSPKRYGASQSERLNVLYNHYNSTKLNEMLSLKDMNIEYDATPIRRYYDKFDVVHGLSLAKNASEKNIYEYMGSGTSGHTHRLNQRYITNRHASYVWLESGCLRTKESVEYIPTAKVVDWTQGFVTVYFSEEYGDVSFFAETHPIINGKCRVNGIIYGN